jgi:hypothetical protein
MRTWKHFKVMALIAIFSIILGLIGCPTPDNGNRTDGTIPTFTSISDLEEYLADKPANTQADPYVVKLKIGDEDDFKSLINTLSGAENKYIYLDLSGSTIAAIPAYAFIDFSTSPVIICPTLTGITIPTSVTSIGDSAFSACTSLSSITIPDNVISIGNRVFSSCTSLASITIGNGVTNIGINIFSYCDNLTEINVDANNINYSSEQGVLYNKNKTSLIKCPIKKTGTFTIQNSVVNIANDAFTYCSSLTSVTIGNSVTSIEDGAFQYCSSLTSIVVDVGNTAYTAENGVLYNKDKTFLVQYPVGKTDDSFVIPNSVTSIGHSVFFYCNSLTNVTIQNGVNSIGVYAFYGCGNLTSITLPNSVTSIDTSAFGSCTSLTSVTIEGTITSYNNGFYSLGDLYAKYRDGGGIGTYTTTAPVDNSSVWVKQE